MPKLMVVDDEVDVREYLKRFFGRRKIEVLTAESGEQALDILATERPDLILLDIRMTGINGIEMLRKLREQGNQVRVIMVTGVEDKSLLDPLKELGVLDCIHKPLILDELEKIVMRRLTA